MPWVAASSFCGVPLLKAAAISRRWSAVSLRFSAWGCGKGRLFATEGSQFGRGCQEGPDAAVSGSDGATMLSIASSTCEFGFE